MAEHQSAAALPGGTADARSAILRRVGAALQDAPSVPEIPRTYQTGAETDALALFAERVDDYNATVEIVSPSRVAVAVANALRRHNARNIVVPVDLPSMWLSATDADVVVDEPLLSTAELNAVDAVVTGAALAIALTGTVVLDAGPAQGRRVLTLLPDVHVCVVYAEQIVATVPEAIARLDPRRPQTWISGPSATSDIELNRVEGVHGSRTLHILIVANNAASGP